MRCLCDKLGMCHMNPEDIWVSWADELMRDGVSLPTWCFLEFGVHKNLRVQVLVASRWQASKSVPIWGNWHIVIDFQSMSWHVQRTEIHILQGGSSIAGCDRSRREDGQLVSIQRDVLSTQPTCPSKGWHMSDPRNRQLVAMYCMSPWPTHD